MRGFGLKRVLLASALIASPLTAQDAPSDDEIVVVGKTEADAVKDLAETITRRSRVDKPISRFQDPVCLKVSGMPEERAALVEDRIEANARQVGAKLAEPDCKINTLVAFVNDAPGLFERLREDEPWLFNDMMRHEFDRVAKEDSGVRAWHTQMMRDSAGREIPYEVVLINGRHIEMPVLRVYKASRLQIPISMELTGSVVLIDLAHVSGKTFRQLADYASMRILGMTGSERVEGSDTRIPTIMTLFDEGETAPAGWTEFDQAYLTALYDTQYYARSGSVRNMTLRRYRGLIADKGRTGGEIEPS